MKICSKCEVEKELEEFHKDRQKKDGLCSKCKNCMKKYFVENREKIEQYKKEHYKENKEEINRKSKEYQKKNRAKLLEQKKEYREKNKEEIRQQRKDHYENNKTKLLEQNKKYRKENVEKIRKQKKEYDKINREKLNQQKKEYIKRRRENDPQFRISCSLRRRTNSGIIAQGGIKSASTQELLGCSFEFARKHIESQFTKGMNWENHGEWEIDHIRPIASFDLTDFEQQKECCHYTNLRPLWVEENRNKSSWWNGIKH